MDDVAAVSGPVSSGVAETETRGGNRLLSLDVLRGITIAFMIFVNSSGEQSYWPFHHADWNGWTPTDLVFPTFLFLVGVSIVFAFDARRRRGVTRRAIMISTIRRALILFALGLVMNGFPYFHFSTMRIYGVLQRIAICYLIVGLLYLWDRRPASKIVLVVAALVGYWALVRFVPVPGHGVPGRDIPFLDKDNNLVAWLDRRMFPGRLWDGTRDPEGLISNLPSLATTLLGVLTGLWLKTRHSLRQKCLGLAAAGVAGIVLGELWNPWFPINKKMWTSSYVLLAAGCSLLALALCYWIVEIRGWKRGWTFFWLVFGTNAITAYAISELLPTAIGLIHVGKQSVMSILYWKVFFPIHPPGMSAAAFALFIVLLVWVPVTVLYVKRIFIKI
jgi:predicted acyltransferase